MWVTVYMAYSSILSARQLSRERGHQLPALATAHGQRLDLVIRHDGLFVFKIMDIFSVLSFRLPLGFSVFDSVMPVMRGPPRRFIFHVGRCLAPPVHCVRTWHDLLEQL